MNNMFYKCTCPSICPSQRAYSAGFRWAKIPNKEPLVAAGDGQNWAAGSCCSGAVRPATGWPCDPGGWRPSARHRGRPEQSNYCESHLIAKLCHTLAASVYKNCRSTPEDQNLSPIRWPCYAQPWHWFLRNSVAADSIVSNSFSQRKRRKSTIKSQCFANLI